MRRIVLACLTCLTCCLLLAQPVAAQRTVITGKTAQALECSVLLFGASEIGESYGFLTRGQANQGRVAALYIAQMHLGLTERETVQALSQRWSRRSRQLNVGEFIDYYMRTSRWCQREFL